MWVSGRDRTTVTRVLMPIAVLFALLSMCAARPITLVPTGQQSIGNLKIDAVAGWNTLNFESKGGPPTAVWTCDGSLLDRLMIYGGVGDDRPLSNERDKVGLPRFRVSMPQSDLVTFIETNLAAMFGDDPAVVASSNVRAQDFGGHPGILFELDITPVELAHYKGTAGAFVAEQKLYLIMYIGADPYYYDARLAAAQQMIVSARL